MSLHHDKKRKTWYFRVRVGNRHIIRRNKDWTERRLAKKAEQEFLRDLENKDFTKIDSTFDDVLEAYIEYLQLHRKQSTVSTSTFILNNHARSYFGEKPIAKITAKNIEDYQRHLLNKTYLRDGVETYYSNSTLSKIQIQVKLVFDYALRHRIISFNPFNQVETVTRHIIEEKDEITIITNEEFMQFMQVIDDEEIEDLIDRSLFSVLYWCGLRIGEALALNVGDLDLKKKTLTVNKNYDTKNRILTTTKTSNSRIVDIPDKCLIELQALINRYNTLKHKKSFALFGLRKRLSKSSLERRKALYIEKADVPYFTFHELRHTHVSTLINLGMRDIDIAKRLGHSVEMVNNTYGHLFESDKQNMMEKLNKL